MIKQIHRSLLHNICFYASKFVTIEERSGTRANGTQRRLFVTTGAALKEDDLTPNRLCRFYRYRTQKYIQETGKSSFLWRKYSPREDRMMATCFRGGEYLESLTHEEASYLLSAVRELDAKVSEGREQPTKIGERVVRIFEAKRISFDDYGRRVGYKTRFAKEENPRG